MSNVLGSLDIHSITAKAIFNDKLEGVPVNEIKSRFPELRRKAKSVNFAVAYWGERERSTKLLAESLDITIEEADELYHLCCMRVIGYKR